MNKQRYIMVIDEGTTSARAIVFNHQGNIVSMSQKSIKQYFPHPGWVEQDPVEIWKDVESALIEALIKKNIEPYQIQSLGIANQRETAVVWNKDTGKPICKAIVWQSKQTSKISDQIKEAGYSKMIHHKTGLIIDSYFSATKLKWILDHVPNAREDAEAGKLLFGTVDTWLLWNLTGGKVFATDYSNASRTMMFNIHTLKWDPQILRLLKIPSQMLPKVYPSDHLYGHTGDYTFEGLKIPITGIMGDQQASLFGQLALSPGMVKNTYGTGAFIMMNTGEKPILSDNGLITTIAYGFDGKVNYALEGSIFVAGSAIQWLKDGMRIINDPGESEVMAREAPNHCGVYVVPAFSGLGAPYWNQQTRGAVFGLTRGTTREEFVKATLNSLAYQTKDVLRTMQKDTHIDLKNLNVDGGATKNDYLMQFQADLLGIPIHRAVVSEVTALGIAYLSGLASGYWKDLDEVKRCGEKRDEFKPKMSVKERNHYYLGWLNAVKAAQVFKGIKY
ncbi:glycerol kinase GlpK [Acetilactobacillus jinshanensis]|uniref:Glycerol kinase n=1 Tax=Acetilactobacillus jinshanensis TaxID=1720083 RepID=A0A4V1ALR9_9LACO|nr:glycerol kinase GlpK [Acetilactobacillus jinshanensis]QBP18559.1 glycerol kinase [Acetilactobacillus jinshanensis]URL61433.1 glycerol kinase GlpK [uncultured bacterium]